MPDDKGAPGDESTGHERRHNLELRERLDQIMDLARHLYREASQMSQEELEEARERVEWLAQEIWEAAVYGPLEERSRDAPDDTGEDKSGG
jgi:Lon protease-like protein